MTNEEATKIIEGEKKCLYYQLNGMCGDFEKCVKTKLDFPYYKVELAFETAIEALEKQIPKQPKYEDVDNIYGAIKRTCTACGDVCMVSKDAKPYEHYCRQCGQALDLSCDE